MKRFLVCGGLHGSDTALMALRRLTMECRPDGLFFVGGILAPERLQEPARAKESWTDEEHLFVQRFFEMLGELDVFTAVLPGPFDTPLEDFLRLGMDMESEYPNLRLAHANLIALDGLAVCGIGGCLVEESSPEPDTYSHLRADYFLRSLDLAEQPRKILLLPSAPLSLGGDADGPLIDCLIHSHSADLCVVAGATEHRGIQRAARTLIVNPGCLADGSAAWVSWRRHPGGHVDLLQLAPADHARFQVQGAKS
ncbi:MAG TPA: hypothetical protein VMG10_12130 [Gemmataceae bacterium]|nr:hypothetical protein [Gemmataceae bacterium]